MTLWDRPTLDIEAPADVRVGEPFVVRLHVDSTRSVQVSAIELALHATESYAAETAPTGVPVALAHPPQREQLAAVTMLNGRSSYSCELCVPRDRAPSYEGTVGRVRYRLEARVRGPWWPDTTREWPLLVRANGTHHEPRPGVVAGDAGSRFELSLESQRVSSGGFVGGVLALRQASSGPVSFDVRLREVLVLRGSDPSETVSPRWVGGAVTLPPSSAPCSRFRIPVPGDALSLTAHTFSVRWELTVTEQLGSVWEALSRVAERTHVPIEVVDSPDLAALSAELVPPPLGSGRREALLAEVARAGTWSSDAGALTRTLPSAHGAVSARIEWLAGARAETLRARVSLPPLGIGLRVERATVFDVFRRDVSVGDPELDAMFRIDAREAAQAAAFLGPIARVAQAPLVSADDESLTCEREEPHADVDRVLAFARGIDQLLRAVPAALAAIPAPTEVEYDHAAAERVTRLAEGTFHPGDLGIRGVLEERAFRCGLAFAGGHCIGLEVLVTPLAGGPLEVGSDRSQEALVGLPQAARAIVAVLPPDIRLVVDDGVGRALVAVPDAGTFHVDHDRAWALARALIALAHACTPQTGAFR